MRLENKVAVITGAASGFGAGIAREFANQGAYVVIADLNGFSAEQLATQIGDRARAVRTDVTVGSEVRGMLDTALDAFGGEADILVNNAGYSHANQPMLDVDETTFDRIFEVNVKAVYLAAQEIVPRWRKKGTGVMVNVASTAGLRPRPGLTWYNASKGALITLGKSMAVELAPDGIRVNAICPVMGDTGMLECFMGVPDTPENRAKFIATIPMGRMSRPDDIAHAAVYLASDEAAMVTGAALEVDGGRCI